MDGFLYTSGIHSPSIQKIVLFCGGLQELESTDVKAGKVASTISLGSKIVLWDAMRSFLINKNLCLYYWLKKNFGKNRALGVAKTIERMILIFGRDPLPTSTVSGMVIQEQDLQAEIQGETKNV